MPEDPKDEGIEVKGGPGCGWVVVTLIVCITIYNLAELYFGHRR